MDKLEHIMQLKPQHWGSSLRLQWIVRGEKGAIEFHCNLGDFGSQYGSYDNPLVRNCRIEPWGIEMHSPEPFSYNPDAEATSEFCEILGGPCWSDGSSSNALELYDSAVISGNWNAIWNELDEWYHEKFEKEDVDNG